MQPCPICPRTFQPIRGDGPLPCKLMGIGERPGENENKMDQVFIGRSGQELDETYLPLAGLHRGEDIRLTNACKCFAESNKTPTDKEIQVCGRHWLPSEIARCQPEVIILLGGCASKLTNGMVNLETHHGRPLKVKDFVGSGWSGWVWPTYHPASGMHKTETMTQLLEDFELLGKWLRGKWEPPISKIKAHDYRHAKTIKDVKDYFSAHL